MCDKKRNIIKVEKNEKITKLSKSCQNVVKKLVKILKRVGGGEEEEEDL
jgi:hypothetical protein